MKHIDTITVSGYPGNFPFSLPLFQHTFQLQFTQPIIIIAGDNASGKSTLLEAIAYKLSLPTISSYSITKDNTFEAANKLFESIHIRWRNKTNYGLFFRAEDYIGFVRSIDKLKSELEEEVKELETYLQGEGLVRAKSILLGQKQALQDKYKGELSQKSHGEGFLEIFQSRINDKGVYILDEPEASLSPLKQLSLISLLLQTSRSSDAQFIIATHSPIIMGIPDSTIYYITEKGIAQVRYEDTEHYQIYRSFLENKDIYLRHL